MCIDSFGHSQFPVNFFWPSHPAVSQFEDTWGDLSRRCPFLLLFFFYQVIVILYCIKVESDCNKSRQCSRPLCLWFLCFSSLGGELFAMCYPHHLACALVYFSKLHERLNYSLGHSSLWNHHYCYCTHLPWNECLWTSKGPCISEFTANLYLGRINRWVPQKRCRHKQGICSVFCSRSKPHNLKQLAGKSQQLEQFLCWGFLSILLYR